MSTPVVYWFRHDLRLHDLAGLNAAAATGRPVLPLFILDEDAPGEWRPGGASRWWLHHSLHALAEQLREHDATLHVYAGATGDILQEVIDRSGATTIYCSRAIDPWARKLEEDLHRQFQAVDVDVRRYPGALLFEPEEIQTKAGQPFKVFTPFWRACRAQPQPGDPRGLPREATFFSLEDPPTDIDALQLLPQQPDWASGWEDIWQPGSEGADAALSRFLDSTLADYDESRDHPAREATSRLSPHIHFGEVSLRQLWHAVDAYSRSQPALESQRDKFLAELGWREFSHHLLYHFPTLARAPFKTEFAHFPWLGSEQDLRAWQFGLTGYPIVDAGMRELWQTGYMHNRVRMIVASFLTKHLLVSWQSGARWFWDTLVDADLANNSCSWQWVAGSGADAAPYFRIFNPTLQGRKFDARGEYVRRWVPELAALPDKYLHEPSTAPSETLAEAGVKLGETYPEPMVDHREARESALAAYASIRAN